jgi:hypothetical protein
MEKKTQKSFLDFFRKINENFSHVSTTDLAAIWKLEEPDLEHKDFLSSQIFSNGLIVKKIAQNLTRAKDIFAFASVNKLTYDVINQHSFQRKTQKPQSLKWKSASLWSTLHCRNFTLVSTKYRSKTPDKLKELNIPFIPLIKQKFHLSINLEDQENFIKPLIIGLYSALKKPHNITEIDIQRSWDNPDSPGIVRLFSSIIIEDQEMNWKQLVEAFKKNLNVSLTHSEGGGIKMNKQMSMKIRPIQEIKIIPDKMGIKNGKTRSYAEFLLNQ